MVNLGNVGASLKSSQQFQMKLMMMQNEHSKIMAAINAMKQAADKIRS